MNKIYLVISCSGQYEEYMESIEKGFMDYHKAEEFMHKLELEEKTYRDMANKCRECAGLNKECPLYTESLFDDGIECDVYNPYHDDVNFRIVEVEIGDEEKIQDNS